MTDEAFRRMFVENHARVLRYVEGAVYDRSEAEEIAAEVFTVAWQKFDANEPFGLPWLIRTAMYKVRDHQRRHFRKATMLTALARRAEEMPEPMSRLDILALRNALAKLSGTDAEIVRLTYWDGLSAGEIASVLMMQQGAVWTRLSRARAQLKTLLSDIEVNAVE
ncbi:sigma-70 family RNA polymerase sigma factor [Microbacterium trichothecenolyticum]|uniref:RNA polymerase sigma factor n=1 Tax=Microbacterium trichothecenolyticum TaxID=69370 RepID=UPI001C6F59C6|nr:sigma-70 family RNA polymerase sigma factor [Microbacterium trichothecenolyticum]MBW9121244.1 sigma-70 family RNA polymerase sigma factor [Microbacterium trichothecenolyticum]